MFKIIQEGKAKIKISKESKISKKLPVFYNPVMKNNRDLSVLVLNSIPDKNLNVCLPLAGSGIRGLRFLLELKKNKMQTLFINDYKEDFYDIIKENFSLNKLPYKEVILSNDDANIFLLEGFGFDYIDIDPFGTPNPFLDSSIRRLSRGGILAVTATDTSALSGTYPDACIRKYWAIPLRNELKHEIGIRILIRKVQLVSAQYEKALTPIFSYSKDHYVRIFFRCEKSKAEVDKSLKLHGMIETAGPMWLGSLWDTKLVFKMYKSAVNVPNDNLKDFLGLILEESKIDVCGFFDIHQLCKKNKLQIPKYELLITKLKKNGFKVSRTHFSPLGLKSNIEKEKLLEIIQTI